MKAKKVGAVKLDLVLRGIAMLSRYARNRQVGLVLPTVTYQDLHDICRSPYRYSLTHFDDPAADQQVRRLKRNWVSKQMKVLEECGAVRREPGYSGRPKIVVQRDHGTGDLDDPDGSPGNSYITISGPVIAKWLKFWGTPEVAAYLAAMVADRYAGIRHPYFVRGGAKWFQTLEWFSDPGAYRPHDHVTMDFSPRTLQRGLARLREDGLITWEHSTTRPDLPGRRFRSGRRNIYSNLFYRVDSEAVGEPIIAPSFRMWGDY